MDVRVLEYLIVIEQEKNLSRAAEKIHISQSALSQALAKVEKELGSPLFLRVNRQLIPTRVGQAYLKGAREMIKIRDEVYQGIRALSVQGESRLRIALDPQAYDPFTKTIAPAFQSSHPEIILDPVIADSLLAKEYLLNDVADAAVLCIKPNSNSMLDLIPLYRDRLIWCIPQGFLSTLSIHSADASRFRLPFIFPAPTTYFRPIYDSVLSQTAFIPSKSYEAEDFNGMKQLMEQGYGVALLPEKMTEENRLYRRFPLQPPMEYPVFFAIPRYSSSAGAKTLQAAVREMFPGP